MINSYTKILAVGHKYLEWKPDDLVVIQEKVDGSQFSMMKKDGVLFCRSNNTQINLEDAGMFGKAVETARTLDLHDGWVYRCEYLQKPKHNTLAYGRTPKGNLILFDVDTSEGLQNYLGFGDVAEEAQRLGIECVPTFWFGPAGGFDGQKLDGWLSQPSVLGGMVEGVVIKNYARINKDGKVSMAKCVSEKFKEVHTKDWKDRNPSRSDYMEDLVDEYKTPARWMKAVQHLREQGELCNAMNDIPILMKAASQDILAECRDEIADKLFDYFWKKYSRKLTHGLPEWYKEYLTKEQP